TGHRLGVRRGEGLEHRDDLRGEIACLHRADEGGRLPEGEGAGRADRVELLSLLHPTPHADTEEQDACRDEGEDDRDRERHREGDRKSTRLNSSHVSISYAVFCLKKKKNNKTKTEK